jgi:hypothetical protein
MDFMGNIVLNAKDEMGFYTRQDGVSGMTVTIKRNSSIENMSIRSESFPHKDFEFLSQMIKTLKLVFMERIAI